MNRRSVLGSIVGGFLGLFGWKPAHSETSHSCSTSPLVKSTLCCSDDGVPEKINISFLSVNERNEIITVTKWVLDTKTRKMEKVNG